MSGDVTVVVSIISIVIWIVVSREAIKPTKEIHWRKMMTLLFVGTLSTLVLLLSLFQDLPFKI